MAVSRIHSKSVRLECNGVRCRFTFTIGHSLETIGTSLKNNARRFADTVTKDQLLDTANYRLESVITDDKNHRAFCKITEKTIFDAHSIQIVKAKRSSSKKAQSSRNYGNSSETNSSQHNLNLFTITSGEMEPIPSKLQFLLNQPDVAVDITDSSTEFEFTAEEILSGGVQATMIILPKPTFQTE